MFSWIVGNKGQGRSFVELFGYWERSHNNTDIKVKEVGQCLGSLPPQNSFKSFKLSTYSPLHLLWWASLLYGARGQLTDLFPAKFELSSLDGTNGFFIPGEAEDDRSGYSVSSAGDVNGDGVDDLVIGTFEESPSATSQAGKSYVVFGNSKMFSGGTLDLASLDGTNGFMIKGETIGDRCGKSVSGAGDVNGDGLADLVIGAEGASSLDSPSFGKSYVLFGSHRPYSNGIVNLSSLSGVNGFMLDGELAYDHSGNSVSGAGDVNGDGLADFVIGAYGATPAARSQAGKSYVVFGSRKVVSGGTMKLSSINGSNGFVIYGESSRDFSGISVSGAGDVNGDGLADLVIGASAADPSGRSKAGKSYVVFGNRAMMSGGILDLSTLNGTLGFILNCDSAGDQCGNSVSSAGDVNGDGLSDFVIGASYASPSGRTNAGKSYVVFGSERIVTGGKFELSGLDAKFRFFLNGESVNDTSGSSVSSAGDVNGDGLADLLIGAYNANVSGKLRAGKSYVIFGSKSIETGDTLELSNLEGKYGFILNGEAAGDHSGRSVSTAGDVNGDGLEDFIIGAPNADLPGKSNTGKTYVIFGRKNYQSSDLVTTYTIQRQTISTNLKLTDVTQLSNAFQTLLLQSTNTDVNRSVISISSEQLFDRTEFIVIGIGAGILGLGCSILGGCLFINKKYSTPNEQPGNVNVVESNYDLAPVIDDDKQDHAIKTNYQQMPQRPVGTHYEALEV